MTSLSPRWSPSFHGDVHSTFSTPWKTSFWRHRSRDRPGSSRRRRWRRPRVPLAASWAGWCRWWAWSDGGSRDLRRPMSTRHSLSEVQHCWLERRWLPAELRIRIFCATLNSNKFNNMIRSPLTIHRTIELTKQSNLLKPCPHWRLSPNSATKCGQGLRENSLI